MGKNTTPERLLKRITKRAPHLAAGIKHWRNDWLREIEGWVAQCRGPDADDGELARQIDLAFERKWGGRMPNSPEGDAILSSPVIVEYVTCCRDLAGYPAKTVSAAFGILRRRWADGSSAEDELTMMEDGLREWVERLDDRTKYILVTLLDMSSPLPWGLLGFLNELASDIMGDFDIVDRKRDEFRDDPELQVLVKLNDLLAQVDAAGQGCQGIAVAV